MSTILEALRRLQADREEERAPQRDLREALTEPLAKERFGRSRKRGVGMGAASAVGGVCLGAALGFWIFSARGVGSWSLPDLGLVRSLFAMSQSDAGTGDARTSPGSGSPTQPPASPASRPQAGLPIAESTQSESRPVAAEGMPAEDSRPIRDFDPAAGAAQDSPRVSSSAPVQATPGRASAAGERAIQPVAGNDAAAAVDPGSSTTAPGAPSAPRSTGSARGFSAVAQPRSPRSTERAAATPAAPQAPGTAPRKSAAAGSSSKTTGVYVTPQTPAEPVVSPKPPTRTARQAEPRRAPKPPAPAVPAPPATPPVQPAGAAPGGGLDDPLPFPDLAVANVRWHPDPKRREASVEVDGAVAINAREGDLVGGALLSRISPGEVEFRVGQRSKVVLVGR